MLFKLKPGVGNHAETDPKTGEITVYHANEGKIIESQHNLVQLFPDKFERVNIGGVTEQEKEEVQKAAEKGAKDILPKQESNEEEIEDTEEKEEEKGEIVPIGKDVTEEKFPEAKEQDFKVFYSKEDRGYFVTEFEDISTALNDEPLKKREVNPFIESYLAEKE
jgi:hypothetical protein